MSIRLLVCLAVVIPTVAVCVLSFLSATEKFQTSSEAERLTKAVYLANGISSVIHELQIERGKTVGLITSGFKQKNKNAVQAQRGKVDAAASAFKEMLAAHEIESELPEIVKWLTPVLQDLGERTAIRSGVDAQSATVPHVAKYYTTVIDEMITVIGHAVAIAPNVDISHRMSSFETLIRAKEHGGLERAFGAALFNMAATGEVSQARFNAYLSRLTGERLTLHRFRTEALPEHIAWLDEALKIPETQQVQEWRKVLADINVTRDGQGINGAEWFGTATTRLNAIKSVEDRIGIQTAELSLNEAEAIRSIAYLKLIVSILVFLLCSGLAVVAITRLATGMRSTLNDLKLLSEGAFDSTQEFPGRMDEFGQINSSLHQVVGSMSQWAKSAGLMSKGSLDAEFKTMSALDILGMALESMRQRLELMMVSATDVIRN